MAQLKELKREEFLTKEELEAYKSSLDKNNLVSLDEAITELKSKKNV